MTTGELTRMKFLMRVKRIMGRRPQAKISGQHLWVKQIVEKTIAHWRSKYGGANTPQEWYTMLARDGLSRRFWRDL